MLKLSVDISEVWNGKKFCLVNEQYNKVKSVLVHGKTKDVEFVFDEQYALENEFWDGEFVVLVPKDKSVKFFLTVLPSYM